MHGVLYATAICIQNTHRYLNHDCAQKEGRRERERLREKETERERKKNREREREREREKATSFVCKISASLQQHNYSFRLIVTFYPRARGRQWKERVNRETKKTLQCTVFIVFARG
jgi:hypothetical protein